MGLPVVGSSTLIKNEFKEITTQKIAETEEITFQKVEENIKVEEKVENYQKSENKIEDK